VADFDFVHLLTEQEWSGKDPHRVLRAIHRVRQEADLDALGAKDNDLAALLERLEQCLTEGEAAAALRAEPPTPDTHVFVRSLAERGLRLAVVTNNSPHVAESYLQAHGLYQYFEKAVHGRTDDPGLMKPHPDVLRRALRDLGLRSENAVMIGDTDTDLRAAERAGVRFIGYDTAPLARARLHHAGAKVVLGAYAPLLGEAGR
jgi:HAD superfamily hydrolase (TIGR01509 family)